MVLRRFLPLLVIAFVTGTLFRIGDQYGIPVFRMFGTWGIVAIGIWGARILRRIQLEDGLRHLEERLSGLSQKVRVDRVGAVNQLPVWILRTPTGSILLGASDVSHGARKKRADRILGRQAKALLAAAEAQKAFPEGDRPVAALVLLRRGLGGRSERLELADGSPPVLLVNPEGLGELVAAGA